MVSLFLRHQPDPSPIADTSAAAVDTMADCCNTLQ
jgi:hypothetical protein